MGTTLTGTTPQDTYDSLIKVTDNGPISGTAKFLSDGLGNDSVLALSTTAVGLGTNTPVGKLTIAGTSAQPPSSGTTPNSLLQIRGSLGNQLNIGSNTVTGDYGSYIQASDTNLAIPYPLNLQPIGGNVGIGTSTPSTTLSVAKSSNSGSGSTFPRLGVLNTLATQGDGSSTFNFSDIQVASGDGSVNMFLATTFAAGVWAPSGQINVSSNHPLIVKTNNTEVARFLAAGGLTFNGDTAAANALDDYEEGTWTMGVSFGGLSVGVTTSTNTGTYTKIGRQVTVNGYILLSSKGSSTGNARITGLPFTIGNSSGNSSSPSLYFSAISFANIIVAYGVTNTTTVELEESTEAGTNSNITNSDFANNSAIVISFTYFV